jgi:hypothetical protein
MGEKVGCVKRSADAPVVLSATARRLTCLTIEVRKIDGRNIGRNRECVDSSRAPIFLPSIFLPLMHCTVRLCCDCHTLLEQRHRPLLCRALDRRVDDLLADSRQLRR